MGKGLVEMSNETSDVADTRTRAHGTRRLLGGIRKAMARRKERRFYPQSVSLTIEQIEWLRDKENSSEILRKMIDEAMAKENRAADKATEEKLDKLWEDCHMLHELAQASKPGKKARECYAKMSKIIKEIFNLQSQTGVISEKIWLDWTPLLPVDEEDALLAEKSLAERRYLATVRLKELEKVAEERAG